jgi:hypothetical protein
MCCWLRRAVAPVRWTSVCREERTHHRDHRVHREDRKFKKDVNLEGTNSISPLESTKVSKNELETNWKNGLRIGRKAQTKQKSDPETVIKGGQK